MSSGTSDIHHKSAQLTTLYTGCPNKKEKPLEINSLLGFECHSTMLNANCVKY